MRDVLLETWSANGAMNLGGRGVRTIAAIFSHMHNTRLNWLRKSAPHLPRPEPLNPNYSTLRETASAHKRSARQCLLMLTEALSDNPSRRVTKFSRDAWMPVWPAGAAMFAYMFAHEAHHRGQALMLAHQLGCRIPIETAAQIWNWDRLWKRQGFTTRPR